MLESVFQSFLSFRGGLVQLLTEFVLGVLCFLVVLPGASVLDVLQLLS